MRLTDTQLLILCYAARQEDGRAWPFPKTRLDPLTATDGLLKTGLLKRKSVEETRPHFGRARGVGPFVPVITSRGLKELGLEA